MSIETSRPAAAVQLGRRLVRHLFRRTSLLALLGASVAAGVVALAGLSSAAGQVSLVVIGTLISLALVPDEPVRLWNVQARAMAETIPYDKLTEAGRQLVGAYAIQAGELVPAAVMSDLWTSHVDDLDAVARSPFKVVRDLDYRVTVTPRSAGTMLVECDVKSDRFLPGADEVYVALCSSMNALMLEFGAQSNRCLLRELVHLREGESLGSWVQRVRASNVTMTCGAQALKRIRVDVSNVGGDDTIVRFFHEAGPVAHDFHGVRLNVAYDNVDTGEFPVKFSSYFCVGLTRITFELRGGGLAIQHNEYLSTSTRSIGVESVSTVHSQRVMFATEDHAVLPPGSGVVFQWRNVTTTFLKPCGLALTDLPDGEPIPPANELPTRKLESDSSSEELVEISGVEILDVYGALGLLEPRSLRVRSNVLERLQAADRLLPDGFRLVVLDAWRSKVDQQRLMLHYSTAAVEGGYVADPGDETMRPPHLTGGAVDVTLMWDGSAPALGTEFDSFDVAAHLGAFEDIDSVTRRLRRILYRAMDGAGFAPYPLEWWHWSYGDDVWANSVGAPTVRYETIDS